MPKSQPEVLKAKRLVCANPECGNRFTPTSAKQRFCCPQCRRSVEYKACAKMRAETRENTINKCAWCGKEYVRYTGGAKYCSKECRLIANGRKSIDGPVSRRGRGGKPKLSLAKANALARAEGLSYGKYFGQYGYGGYFGE